MRYRRLPIEREYAGQPPEVIGKAWAAMLVETMSTKGFQLVTGILRRLEQNTLDALRCGLYGQRPDLGTGRLQVIEEIRRSLVAMLPAPERAHVDWSDDQDEGYTALDPDAPDDNG